MDRSIISENDKCTAAIAARLISRSRDTGRRYMLKLRKAKGYAPYEFVSVGEFIEFYRLKG